MISMRRLLPSISWLLVTIMFLLGPIAVGRMGAYMRYVGDDYCYSSALKSGGFFQGQISSFQMVQRFNGDRYSLTLISFTTELFGPKGNAAAVAVMLLLWLGGLAMATYQILKVIGFEHVREPSLAISSTITFFILLTYPDLFSAIYWVSAMYSYFAAMVTVVWLTAVILSLFHAGEVKTWKLLVLFVITWLLGAFSEAGTVIQVVWLFVMALSIWKINKGQFRKWDRRVILVPVFATLLALVTMILSPYGMGFLTSSGPTINIGNLIGDVLKESLIYNLGPGNEFRTPFLVEVMILGALGLLLSRRLKTSVKLSIPAFVMMVLVFFIIGWILIAVAFFPSYLVLKSYPSPRALMPAHIIRQLEYALISLSAGWFIGLLMQKRRSFYSTAAILASMLMLLASVYPIRGYRYFFEREPFMKNWSFLWDQRDDQIRDAIKSGHSSVEVMVLDHPIPNLAELGPDPNSAYNQCAQEYYGISMILANQPGWEDFEIP